MTHPSNPNDLTTTAVVPTTFPSKAPSPGIGPNPAQQLEAALARSRRQEGMKWLRWVGVTVLAVGLTIGLTLAVLAWMPQSEPDILQDDMDDVLEYALLSDEFNNLPVERRLELIKELVQRLKTMSSDDSVVMASFATQIKSEMRRQVEENVKRLAADTIDMYAKDYANVEPEDQAEFLDQTMLDFTRMMEDIAGEPTNLPEGDAERIQALKDQAKRDEGRLREDTSPLTTRRATRFFEFIHRDEDRIADPVQRGRSARFMRDMTRHLRGQDISTGRPKDGPG